MFVHNVTFLQFLNTTSYPTAVWCRCACMGHKDRTNTTGVAAKLTDMVVGNSSKYQSLFAHLRSQY